MLPEECYFRKNKKIARAIIQDSWNYGGDPYVGQAVRQNQMPIKKPEESRNRKMAYERSQRLCLVIRTRLFDKINGIITADDFVWKTCIIKVAAMVFERP